MKQVYLCCHPKSLQGSEIDKKKKKKKQLIRQDSAYKVPF
jgi:hypothetical protein